MTIVRFNLRLFWSSLFISLLLTLGLTPFAAQAQQPELPPRATPTSAPPADDTGNDDNGDDSNNDRRRSADAEEILPVILSSCDLACTVDRVVEVQADVQLIHLGSGWIAETTLSTARDTLVTVPYAGAWEVWLVRDAQLVTISTNQPNVKQPELLKPEDLPFLLGTIQTGLGVQTVPCPINCPTLDTTGTDTKMSTTATAARKTQASIAPAPTEASSTPNGDPPPALPTTGENRRAQFIGLFMSLFLVLSLVGSTVIKRNRIKPPHQR